MNAPRFDVARFSELRQARGLSWGESITFHAETGSTNDEALQAARRGAPAGSVFVADHQSAGRGRAGKSWLSRPGAGLLFSVLLRPTLSSERAASLTLAAGLGVRAALEQTCGGDFSVKWPNDVLGGRRKLAGVLCEGQLAGRELTSIVIGVGVNLERQELPPELAESSTSLQDLVLAGQVVPAREVLLVEALAAIEARAARHQAHGFSALHEEFARHDALAGRRVAVSGNAEVRGVARGVDGEGQLLVEDEGVLVRVRSGTVRVVE